MNRDFKGIWIPKEVWLSKDLTMQEKIFFVEIDSLDNENGCFTTNGYFADFFGISKTRVSLVIKSLVEKGFIKSTIIYKDGSKEILKRVLNICYTPSPTKVKEPPQQKLKDNNTLNNTMNKEEEEEVLFYKQVDFINHLRLEYKYMPLMVKDCKYHFAGDGKLKEDQTNVNVVSGLTKEIFKTLFKNQKIVLNYLKEQKGLK